MNEEYESGDGKGGVVAAVVFWGLTVVFGVLCRFLEGREVKTWMYVLGLVALGGAITMTVVEGIRFVVRRAKRKAEEEEG